MPRYDYRCTECASEFELVQKFREAGQGECPTCGGAGQRVFHAVPVIYKGSGFYTTDYGRPKRPAESAESKEAGASDSGSSSDTGGGSNRNGSSGEKAADGGGSSSGSETAAAAAAGAASGGSA